MSTDKGRIIPETDAEFQATISRRQFLQRVGIAAGLVVVGMIPAFANLPETVDSASGAEVAPLSEKINPLQHIIDEDQPFNYPGHSAPYAPPPGDQKWAMVIDVHACVGCRKCVYACVKENNIGRDSGFTYIKVLEMEAGSIDLETSNADYTEGGNPEKWYMPVQCMHCAKPTCVYGCPVIATWKDPDGIVIIDYDKCIACRNCMVTCPYAARHFNWVEPEVPENEVNPSVPLKAKAGTVEKCTFCVQRTRKGGTTACTEACPVGARKFGDLNDPNSEVSVILRTRRAWRLKEDIGSGPMIWYVG
jgi:Fe-S-cluster-containing dehydrogenase component